MVPISVVELLTLVRTSVGITGSMKSEFTTMGAVLVYGISTEIWVSNVGEVHKICEWRLFRTKTKATALALFL